MRSIKGSKKGQKKIGQSSVLFFTLFLSQFAGYRRNNAGKKQEKKQGKKYPVPNVTKLSLEEGTYLPTGVPTHLTF